VVNVKQDTTEEQE